MENAILLLLLLMLYLILVRMKLERVSVIWNSLTSSSSYLICFIYVLIPVPLICYVI